MLRCVAEVNGRSVETWQPHETIMLCLLPGLLPVKRWNQREMCGPQGNDTTFFDLTGWIVRMGRGGSALYVRSVTCRDVGLHAEEAAAR